MTDLLDTESIMVRVGHPADAAILAAIHARCFERPWDDKAMVQFLGVPGAIVLIASRHPSGPAQGFLIARAAADEAELITLCMLPEFRRQGIARMLLETAASMLRAGGVKCLFLEVDENNDAALSLYRALGAGRVGRRQAYYARGGNAAIFSLALSVAPSDDMARG